MRYSEFKTDELENQMSRQSLQQDSRKIKFGNGTQIICSSRFSLREIKIFVPQRGKKVEEITAQDCFCCCYFAIGKVVGFSDQYEHNDSRVRYDVQVCQRKEVYTLFRYCMPTDFAQYKVVIAEDVEEEIEAQAGELVIVFLHELPVDICCQSEETEEEFDPSYACNQTAPEIGANTSVFRVSPFYVRSLKRWEMSSP